MSRPIRSVRCRVRASALAALSLGGFALLGVSVPSSADGAMPAKVRSIFREMKARLRPGGLDAHGRPLARSREGGGDGHGHRHGGAHARRREASLARARDSRPWESAYQLAEGDLRQGNHAGARQRFEELVARAPTRADRELAEYQILLTELLAGREEPARGFLAEADRNGKRSPAYFYLQTALARSRGENAAAQRWLAQSAQVKARTPAAVRRRYAASLNGLDAQAAGEETAFLRASASNPAVTPARVAVLDVLRAPSPPPPESAGNQRVVPTNPAVLPPPAPALRSLVAGGAVPPPPVAFRTTAAGGEGNTPPTAGPTPIPEASRRPDAPRGGGRPPGAGGTPAPSSPAAAPAAPTPPGGRSLAEAPPAVREKFETAQGLYSRRDCPGALQLLNEIEAVQPNVTEVRNLRALVHYELAYRQYIQQDYPGALRELDEADEAQAVADTANLRGLVHARQRQYDRAEAAFKKAVAADPTLWAAKFNLADLPFSYRNYTEARQRFEALTAETDRATQPRQAELTEFKVFLTLLLEGRESAARSFQSRFKPDAATPARLYSQAALDFHAGRFDRAIESVKEARKKYPPQLEAIFAESFYRVGWLTDGMLAPGNAVAAAPSPTPAPSVAPAAVAAVSPAPEAAASPVPTPPAAAAAPAPEVTPAVAAASVAPTPAPAAVPTPAASEPTPALAVATPPPAAPAPTSTPTPPAVAAQATPSPTAQTSPAPVATPAPATAAATPDPEPLKPASPTRSPADRLIRGVLPWVVLLYLLFPWFYAVRVILTRRQRRLRARRVVRLPRYPTADKVLESEKV